MIHLITGGSASGKSAYAEKMAVGAGEKSRYYLATMKPWGKEGQERVEKHRNMRAGKGFTTVECYTCLEQAALSFGEEQPENRVILLECMSNLAANEQFDEGGSDQEILTRMKRGIRSLQKQAETLIIVTNEVFSDGVSYEPETVRYLRLMGEINAFLAREADWVTEVVFGIPVVWKSGQRENENEE